MERQDLLESVGAEAATCPRCDLAETRRNVVFGEGSPDAPLMLIGEGPGEQEDRTGRPFVGPAGILLDKALHANQITRRYVYIANIVKCRPTIVENGRVKNRPPRQPEVEACKPWLLRQLEIVRPLAILCIGGPAASLLIHPAFKITSERGRWSESPYCRAIMATFHPAYILRLNGQAQDHAYDLLVADIAAARRKVIELKNQPAPASSLFPAQ
jgi:DNA polymerase